MNAPAAGWQPDPTGRHEYRYWDGSQWTDDVSDGGVTSIDAVSGGGSGAYGPDDATVANDPATEILPGGPPVGPYEAGPSYGSGGTYPSGDPYPPGAGQVPIGGGYGSGPYAPQAPGAGQAYGSGPHPPGGPGSGGQYPPGGAARKRRSPALIAAIVVAVVLLLGGAAYALTSGGGDDDTGTDETTTTRTANDTTGTTAGPATTDTTGVTDTTEGTSDTTDGDEGDALSDDELIQSMADGIQAASPTFDDEEATCVAEGLVDLLGVDRIRDLQEGGSNPFSALSSEDQSAILDVMTDCAPEDVPGGGE